MWILLFLLVSVGVSAQQDAMYSQYMFNTLAINPAYAGSREVLSITALNRSQWVGVPGAPQTQTVSAHTPIMKESVGVGVQVFNDKVGIIKTTGAFFSYAYRIRMGKSMLAMGLQGGFASFRADYTQVELNTGVVDPTFSQPINKVLPNFGAGVYLTTRKFYIGLSVPHLLRNNLTTKGLDISKSYGGRQSMQFFLTGGYSFDLTSDYCLKTSFLVKQVSGAPIQADISGNLWIKDRVAFGLSYRSASDLVAMIEVQATPYLRFGYAYDYGLKKLSRFNSGSHELMVRYEFGRERDKVLSPRTF
ncbi:MAG: type IX secretion system membrane protein PorP/SprF [Bacteroidota bacterium]